MIVNPTGASPGRWHGKLIAHSSRKVATLGLRRSNTLTLRNSASSASPAIAGAIMGTVGHSKPSKIRRFRKDARLPANESFEAERLELETVLATTLSRSSDRKSTRLNS